MSIFEDEIFWYFAMIAWFIFIGVNVSSTLGFTYYMMMAGAMLLYLMDTNRTIQFSKHGESMLWKIGQGGIIYVIFIVSASIIIPLLQKINVGGIINLLGASTPVLAQSKTLNFLTFALAIPFVETITFIRYFDFAATRLKIRIDKSAMFSLSALFLVAVFSVLFMVLHVSAKGITNYSVLALVFIMMAVSLIASMYYGESKQALWFHCIANIAASIPLFL